MLDLILCLDWHGHDLDVVPLLPWTDHDLVSADSLFRLTIRGEGPIVGFALKRQRDPDGFLNIPGHFLSDEVGNSGAGLAMLWNTETAWAVDTIVPRHLCPGREPR